MPTLRSRYTFQQFRQVMTALAHKAAIEAVTKLESGELLVKAYSPGRLSEVNDGVRHFKFYAKHLSYSYRPDGTYSHPNYISFDVEEKLYLTSNHCTKISFYAPEGREKERRKKITKFIDEIMAGVKTVPRFSLTQLRET